MNISFHRQWGEETHLTSRLHTLRRSWGRNWETRVSGLQLTDASTICEVLRLFSLPLAGGGGENQLHRWVCGAAVWRHPGEDQRGHAHLPAGPKPGQPGGAHSERYLPHNYRVCSPKKQNIFPLLAPFFIYSCRNAGNPTPKWFFIIISIYIYIETRWRNGVCFAMFI